MYLPVFLSQAGSRLHCPLLTYQDIFGCNIAVPYVLSLQPKHVSRQTLDGMHTVCNSQVLHNSSCYKYSILIG